MVSIIVLFADGAEVTVECLRALAKCTTALPFEVILVDNGSQEKERALLERGIAKLRFLTLQFIQFPVNVGYARGSNLAAAKARGKILVFLNNDCIVTRGWLTPLVSFLERYPGVVAVQPKLRSNILKAYFDYSGGAGGFLDRFGYPFTRGRIFDSIEKDIGQYDDPCEITWASGSCFAIRTQALWDMGGFDEYFFSYFEEIDLCVRLRERGYRIFSVPESLVYHYGSYTSNRNLGRKIYMNHRNNLYFVLKHNSLWPYFPLFILRCLFDIGSILYYLSERRFSFVLSVLKAYGALVWHLPIFLRTKVFQFSGRSLHSLATVYPGSIVLDYFLFRRRTYDAVMRRNVGGRQNFKHYREVTFFENR
ncbi:MAG: hypothetical protein A2900_05850 [Candidatus Chisholmbacteria bacterium RIFCSPLOWO2_01_FULL_50_28]|uniref:Glycosyltransferase 2-like domain-containing protein n=1 Tax=Candidatus Chisholmbacteria bacterium RIFCSPHIGHO2_01_FULL_52_32 TaxID=1797591 RepID=A0A1G1VR05_9BACT|nr:MAG: hypothetical protein A2786_05625 [Candidatus Chisholmbacteria bacterium RIFCSPHIGHO2_01_FULL_52_32]OGY20560.1 MAG: hypothetical protein A2900_05850 [Candidatus Chisholmbacteria bacterium RIFCSPLOWO2_01_FULL_50_28]